MKRVQSIAFVNEPVKLKSSSLLAYLANPLESHPRRKHALRPSILVGALLQLAIAGCPCRERVLGIPFGVSSDSLGAHESDQISDPRNICVEELRSYIVTKNVARNQLGISTVPPKLDTHRDLHSTRSCPG